MNENNFNQRKFYFKIVYTCISFYYIIDTQKTITEILTYIIDKVTKKVPMLRQMNFELTTDGELNTAIQQSDLIFGDIYNNTSYSFYIRPLEILYELRSFSHYLNSLQFTLSELNNDNIQIMNPNEDCCVCLESYSTMNSIINCSHNICSNCYSSCISRNIRNCPICRVGVISNDY